MHDGSSTAPTARHVSLRGAIGLCLAVAAVLVAIPVGVRAAGSLVTIASPNGTHKAQVDANGRLAVALEGTAVKVTSPDDPGRHAFQKSVTAPFAQGTNVVVPAGKRLVIQFVSALYTMPIGDEALDLWITTNVNGVQATHVFPALPGVNNAAQRFSVISEQTRVYADAGTQVQLSPHKTGQSVNGTAIVTITGYLMDCAAGGGCH